MFYKLLYTQFGTKIHTLRLDNEREYFNYNPVTYLQNEGIVHQSSCVDAPQQNRTTQKKRYT